jgi:D-sedoheptulose 7-phosphate isomerase
VSEDLLLVLSVRGGESVLSAAVDAAHERDMTVVAMVGGADGELLQTLHDTDVAISIPSDALGRVTEIQQMALHCICDGIDVQLLGEQQ